MQILLSLAPDFLIIALGAWVGPYFGQTAWKHIDRICYYIFYPALLFTAASQRAIPLKSVLLLGSMACVVVTTGFLLIVAGQKILQKTNSANTAGKMQNAWRFNTAMGFVATATLLPIADMATSTLAVFVGIAIPLANIYAIFLLTKDRALPLFSVCKEILLNPFLLASLAGIIVALTNTPINSQIDQSLDKLAGAAIPVLLLSLGSALRGSAVWPPDTFSIVIHIIKLCVLPALVWLSTLIINVQAEIAATLIIFAALPTASAAHVLATQYGAERNPVALVVMQSTALSLITLPLWIAVALSLIKP